MHRLVAAGSFLGSLGLIALAIVMWQQGLEQADRIASVVSMFTGICGLTASVAVPVLLQRRRTQDQDYPGLAWLKSMSLEPSGIVTYLGIVHLPNGRRSEWEVAIPPVEIVATPWENRAEALSALGQSRRLELLRRVLASPEAAVELDSLGSDRTHISALVRAGWLTRIQGNRYQLRGGRTVPLLAIVMAASPD